MVSPLSRITSVVQNEAYLIRCSLGFVLVSTPHLWFALGRAIPNVHIMMWQRMRLTQNNCPSRFSLRRENTTTTIIGAHVAPRCSLMTRIETVIPPFEDASRQSTIYSPLELSERGSFPTTEGRRLLTGKPYYSRPPVVIYVIYGVG